MNHNTLPLQPPVVVGNYLPPQQNSQSSQSIPSHQPNSANFQQNGHNSSNFNATNPSNNFPINRQLVSQFNYSLHPSINASNFLGNNANPAPKNADFPQNRPLVTGFNTANHLASNSNAAAPNMRPVAQPVAPTNLSHNITATNNSKAVPFSQIINGPLQQPQFASMNSITNVIPNIPIAAAAPNSRNITSTANTNHMQYVPTLAGSHPITEASNSNGSKPPFNPPSLHHTPISSNISQNSHSSAQSYQSAAAIPNFPNQNLLTNPGTGRQTRAPIAQNTFSPTGQAQLPAPNSQFQPIIIQNASNAHSSQLNQNFTAQNSVAAAQILPSASKPVQNPTFPGQNQLNLSINGPTTLSNPANFTNSSLLSPNVRSKLLSSAYSLHSSYETRISGLQRANIEMKYELNYVKNELNQTKSQLNEAKDTINFLQQQLQAKFGENTTKNSEIKLDPNDSELSALNNTLELLRTVTEKQNLAVSVQSLLENIEFLSNSQQFGGMAQQSERSKQEIDNSIAKFNFSDVNYDNMQEIMARNAELHGIFNASLFHSREFLFPQHFEAVCYQLLAVLQQNSQQLYNFLQKNKQFSAEITQLQRNNRILLNCLGYYAQNKREMSEKIEFFKQDINRQTQFTQRREKEMSEERQILTHELKNIIQQLSQQNFSANPINPRNNGKYATNSSSNNVLNNNGEGNVAPDQSGQFNKHSNNNSDNSDRTPAFGGSIGSSSDNSFIESKTTSTSTSSSTLQQ
jgi:hypothetical protein